MDILAIPSTHGIIKPHSGGQNRFYNLIKQLKNYNNIILLESDLYQDIKDQSVKCKIVTKECGEIIERANCGYIIDYGDMIGLKKKMIKILKNPKFEIEKINRGKTFIKTNLSWNKVTFDIESIYHDCIG